MPLTSSLTRLHRGRGPPSPELRSFLYDDVAAATSHFHPSALLGRGSHASVFLCRLDGGRLLAAAKVVTSPSSPRSAHHSAAHLSAENEIEILSAVRSPLLVNLLGFTRKDRDSGRIAVFELMPNGSVYDHIHSCGRGTTLTWPRRLRLAYQVAEAISALHSLDPPVIHRDIKSSNILIDERGNARLADFGLAVRGDHGSTPPLPAGTIGYLDPNYVEPADLSTKSDVFSFGVLLLEMITGRKAIDVEHSPPVLMEWAGPLIRRGALPLEDVLWDPRAGKPEGRVGTAVAEVVAVAGRCLAAAAAERPEMGEVAVWLRAAKGRAESSWIWGGLGCWGTVGSGRVLDMAG